MAFDTAAAEPKSTKPAFTAQVFINPTASPNAPALNTKPTPPTSAPRRRAKPAPPAPPQRAPVRYRVAAASTQAHLFAVRMELDHPSAKQRLSLPVWIPGSYLVREFAQHLQGLRATQNGEPVPIKQVNKNTWVLDCQPNQPLCVEHGCYAFDASVRTAFLDATRGFFNATSLCLRAVGQEDAAVSLQIDKTGLPDAWQAATGLSPQAAETVQDDGFGLYQAQNYDELADCPVELGTFWSGEFTARGVPHRFIVSGAGGFFDLQRLQDDTQRICETEIHFWHGESEPPPFKNYLFMLHASAEGYGGLEHRNSTALICPRSDLPKTSDRPPRSAAALKATDGYTTLLGLISHEYFHTWNVKRLRPAEFRRYDYDRENHTELLWFFEGFTSYYDDLFLHRAGLIDAPAYLLLLSKTINQVQQTPGRHLQSVAQASFDAWTRYYRVQENTPNATVSYYTKGALVALCLDLTLRAEGHTTLDAVLRELWRGSGGGPITERQVTQALKRLGQRSFEPELREWVHGTADLPVLELLGACGVQVKHDDAPLAQQLGLRVSEAGACLQLKNVLRGGAAEAAGMAAGDEWLGLEFAPPKRGLPVEAWRVRQLDEVRALRGLRTRMTALVARDKRLLRCELVWPQTTQAVKLSVGELERVRAWLFG